MSKRINLPFWQKAVLAIMLNMPVSVWALPWSDPLITIRDSLTSEVAPAVGAVAIVFFGLLLATTELRGIMGRALQLLFGLSIAITAGSLLSLFGS